MTEKIKKSKKTKTRTLPIYKTRIKVIGIGGGGNSIISEIARKLKEIDFIAVNTDQQALKEVPQKIERFQIGQKLTSGLGTGQNPSLGEQAAREEKERIKEILKEQDLCILISCLGGGTGSGSTPVFAEISRELQNITLGIFTLPFDFEGKKKMQIAKSSLEKMRSNLNAVIIIPNERISQVIDKNTPIKKAFSIINRNLAENLEGLIEMIYQPGLLNIDWANLKTIFEDTGKVAFFNTVQFQNRKQIDEMTKKILFNPLYPYSPQNATDGTVFNITGGLNLNLTEIKQIGKAISNSINPRSGIAFGISSDRENKIKITLITNGCIWKEWEKPEKPKKKAVKIVKTSQYKNLTSLHSVRTLIR